MVEPTHQSLPRIGEHVDQYEVCGEIDSGGMSVIYVVKRAGVGGFQKLLAMKVIMPNLAREERFKSMFLDEARILSLIDHPNVVAVHDVGETPGGLLYMVMDLLRGRSLSRLIKQARKADGHFRRDIALTILADAAEGLHAAHETTLIDGTPANVVHRDVSPQNFHIGYDGSVRVVDFGIAAAEGKLSQTRTGELKGKLAYLAPEQIARVEVDRRADIWALGVVAWEVMAERRLFGGESEVDTLRRVSEAEVPPLRTFYKGVPAAVAEIVAQCLQREVDKRPPTARAVAAALRAGVRRVPGADPNEELARYVQQLLAEDRIIDEERIARAAQSGPAPPVHWRPARRDDASGPFDTVAVETPKVQPPPPPTVEEAVARAPRRNRLAIAGLIVGVVAAAGLVQMARGGATDDPRPRDEASARGHDVPDERVDQVAEPAPPDEPTAPPDEPEPTPPNPPEPTKTAPPPAAQPRAREVVLTLDPRIETVRLDGTVVRDRPVRVRIEPGRTVRVTAFGRSGERLDRALDETSPEDVILTLPRGPTKEQGTHPPTKSPFLGNPYGTH